MQLEKITKSYTFTFNEKNQFVTTSYESLDHLKIKERDLSKAMNNGRDF